VFVLAIYFLRFFELIKWEDEKYKYKTKTKHQKQQDKLKLEWFTCFLEGLFFSA
jgi:hypothetical protein